MFQLITERGGGGVNKNITWDFYSKPECIDCIIYTVERRGEISAALREMCGQRWKWGAAN